MRDLEKAVELAKAVAAEHPDVINPRQGSSCVYEKAEEELEPGEFVNCIAAAILTKAGLPVPPDDGGIDEILKWDLYKDEFDYEAGIFLKALQMEADAPLGSDPVKWGTIDIDALAKGASW